MMHKSGRNFWSYQHWAIGVVVIGLLLLSAQFSPPAAIQVTPTTKPPPKITGFALFSSRPILPGATIRIQANVRRNGHRINNYQWETDAGEESIIDGQGKPFITFQAPDIPGSYKVSVQLEYEGGSVQGSRIVEVLPEAVVVVDVLNLRYGPGTVYAPEIGKLLKGEILKVLGRIANNTWIKVLVVDQGAEGWVSASRDLVQINVDLTPIPILTPPPPPEPTSTPIPIPTPTEEFLEPPPTLLEPPDQTASSENRLALWWAFHRFLVFERNEFFRVEIWNEGELIDDAWTRDTLYEYHALEGRLRGKFTWRITVIQGIPTGNKPWSDKVWEGKPDRLVSYPSEIWTLYVEDRPTPEPTECNPLEEDCPPT